MDGEDFDLESLVHLEQTFFDAGYQDGFAHGRIHGQIEGRALGREKGFEMWEEIGFYAGFARMWAAICAKQGRVDDRAGHLIQDLLNLISQFPRVNSSEMALESCTTDIPKLSRQIRSRYKTLCSILGITHRLRTAKAAYNADDDEGNREDHVRGSQDSVWPLRNHGQKSELDF